MAIRSCLLFIATETIPSMQIGTNQGPERLIFVIMYVLSATGAGHEIASQRVTLASSSLILPSFDAPCGYKCATIGRSNAWLCYDEMSSTS